MKTSLIALTTLVLLCACHKNGKHDTTDSNVAPYFKDILVNEKYANGSLASFQHALGYFSLKGSPNTQIMVASRGKDELSDARGFRIASINKTNGTVNWIKSYDLDDKYYIQLATCAAMDNSGNIWVGGHSFDGNGVAGILFMAKLDTAGNMLWSQSFSNYQGWRAYSLTALANGDLALMAKGFGGLVVLRLTTNMQSVWSTIVYYMNSHIDNDYYGSVASILSPENHAMAETADGSIFFATSSNPGTHTGGVDRLYKLDAGGQLQFAKTYTLDGNQGVVRPVQLINAGVNRLLMADQAFPISSVGPCPFFTMLSLDGNVVASRGRPLDQSGSPGLNINQVNFYQDHIYYSTCGDYSFNTYILDTALGLKNTVVTAAALDIGTDRGGISLFDEADKALYYVLNFGGNYGESNGFEVTRNDASGKPCINTYTVPPATLLLGDNHITVANDTTITSTTYGPAVIFTPLSWRRYQVPVTVTENVCGN